MARQLHHPGIDEFSLPEALAALSDPVRLRIVQRLAEEGQERPWGTFEVGVGPSTLSHHMKVLRKAGLIAHRKEGTRCFVAIRPEFESVFPGLLDCVLRLARPAMLDEPSTG